MRRIVVGVLFVLICSAVAVAQTPNVRVPGDLWRVIFFSPEDRQISDAVTSLVEAGFIPAGYEYEPGESIGMLLVDRGPFELEGWVINEYTDFSTLEQEITAAINSGYVPMDLSRFEDSISILWIESTSLTVNGWRIHSTANTVDSRAEAINQFQEQGFSLWGFSTYEDQAWFLFLDVEESDTFGIISGFPKVDQELREGLLQANGRGFLPSGLAIDPETYFLSMIR